MTDTRAGSSLDLTCDNTTVDSGEPVCWPRAKEINSLINLSSRSWYFITWNNVMWNRVMTLFSLPLMKLAIFPPRFPIPETGHITHLIITSFRLCRLSAYCKMLPSFPWSFPLFFHVIIVSAPVQIVGFFFVFFTLGQDLGTLTRAWHLTMIKQTERMKDWKNYKHRFGKMGNYFSSSLWT